MSAGGADVLPEHFADLLAFAESALDYVDAAAAAERERHRVNGAPHSLVVVQTVADGLRAAIAEARRHG